MFRIVPRQAPDLANGYGFLYRDHPSGKRVMKWNTFEEAMVAAYILRVHPGQICPVAVIFPDEN